MFYLLFLLSAALALCDTVSLRFDPLNADEAHFRCLVRQGYNHLTIAAQDGAKKSDNMLKLLDTARKSTFSKVSFVIKPDFRVPTPTVELIRAIGDDPLAKADALYIMATTEQAWEGTPMIRCVALSLIVTECIKTVGVDRCFVASTRHYWEQIFGAADACDRFSAIKLWWLSPHTKLEHWEPFGDFERKNVALRLASVSTIVCGSIVDISCSVDAQQN